MSAGRYRYAISVFESHELIPLSHRMSYWVFIRVIRALVAMLPFHEEHDDDNISDVFSTFTLDMCTMHLGTEFFSIAPLYTENPGARDLDLRLPCYESRAGLAKAATRLGLYAHAYNIMFVAWIRFPNQRQLSELYLHLIIQLSNEKQSHSVNADEAFWFLCNLLLDPSKRDATLLGSDDDILKPSIKMILHMKFESASDTAALAQDSMNHLWAL